MSPVLNPTATSTPSVRRSTESAASKRNSSVYETNSDSRTKHCHPDRFVTVRRKKRVDPTRSETKKKVSETPKCEPQRRRHRKLHKKKDFVYEFLSSDSDFV